MGIFSSKGVRFNPDTDIPSLEGKVILVTGGNSGLGKQTILELAKHKPAEIWLSARSPDRAQAALNDIAQQVPNAPPIKLLQTDLSSFASIREAATTFRQHSQRLDLLILNAGIMAVPPGTTTDGFELQFGTNHLGHALLTKLLLPTLLCTAQDPSADVRVVVVSSGAHQLAPKPGILFDTLQGRAETISSGARYGQSKLANILFARELARRHPELRVPVVHPGLVATNLPNTMNDNSWFMRVVWRIAEVVVGVDVRTGTLNQLWAATAAGVESGEYYDPVGVLGRRSQWAKDAELAEKLWVWTEKELRDGSE